MPQVQMFILIRLTQLVLGNIMPIIRRTDVNNCRWTKFYLHQLMHFFIQTCISLLTSATSTRK